MIVPTLLDLTFDYVTENIHLVECLEGLPEILGEPLFMRLLQKYFKTDDRYKLHCGLKVFTKTYRGLVLTSLNFSRQLILINEFTDCILPFLDYLTALDMSHCQLGATHEVIQHLSNAENLSLSRLSLRDCGMTDEFLRKLTIPCRVFRRGFVSIKELDLSCNCKLTDKCLAHLSCLHKLDVLFLSGTGVTIPAARRFGEKIGLTMVNNRFEDINWQNVVTKGWAASMVEYWIKYKCSTNMHQDHSGQQRSPTKYFYSHQRARLMLAAELKSASLKPSEQPEIKLMRRAGHTVECQSETSQCKAKMSCKEKAYEEMDIVIAGYCAAPSQASVNPHRNLLDTLNRLEN